MAVSPHMLWPRALRALMSSLAILIATGVGSPAPVSRADRVWQPAPGTTWQWQLSGALDLTVDANVYDVDLFETDAATVAALHGLGRRTICYLSAGSWEDWRPDRADFPTSAIGNDYAGWPGEKWLDIRQIDQLAPALLARLEMCRARGFDAVEPDNIDGYQNDTGFPLTASDQIRFNRWFAQQAHARGLAVALKNDGDQTPDLLNEFDFAIVESCFERGECDAYQPFIAARKAVFAAEYRLAPAAFCADARARDFDALRKNRALDAQRTACR